MKLWKKIACLCSAILIAVVTICSTILLVRSQENILTVTHEQTAERQRSLASSFSQMAAYYIVEEDSDMVEYSLIKYCFSRFADSNSVLICENEPLYSKIVIQPEEYLPLADSYEQEEFSGEIDGRQIYMVGSTVSIRDAVYHVYVVEDVTPVYESTTRMVWQFVLIGLIGMIVGLGFIILLVRRSLYPLEELQAAASHIAAGSYGERAAVRFPDEVGDLAVDFNRMAEAVEQRVVELTEQTERQRLFIGGVTHEFKTPLTAMILNADTLQNACMSEDERMASLTRMESQCKWLERMTQNLLKLITLKQDIEMQPTSVPKLFERVEESVTEILRQRGTPLISECSTDTLHMDADLMKSVLINLVDNASKASAPGQGITMRAYGEVIEVSDQGMGILESELERITEPFYVVDKSRSKKLGGSGLGLALVKEIVSAHGAELIIESSVGVGTTIRVQFKR